MTTLAEAFRLTGKLFDDDVVFVRYGSESHDMTRILTVAGAKKLFDKNANVDSISAKFDDGDFVGYEYTLAG